MPERIRDRRNRIRGVIAGAAAAAALAALIVLPASPAAAWAPDGEEPSSTVATSDPATPAPTQLAESPSTTAEEPAGDPAADSSPGDAPAPDAPAEAPQLSIAIDNGRTSTTIGDRLDYTITVQNVGATAAESLQVTQTRPEGLRFETADGGAIEQPGALVWNVDLSTGQSGTFHSTMTVLATPDDLLRLATVVCVRAAADGPPIVCAADSDQLPAGAKAEADLARMTAGPEEGADQDRLPWYIGGGIAVLVVVVVALLLLWARARRRAVAQGLGPGGADRHGSGLVDTHRS